VHRAIAEKDEEITSVSVNAFGLSINLIIHKMGFTLVELGSDYVVNLNSLSFGMHLYYAINSCAPSRELMTNSRDHGWRRSSAVAVD
jgi:hypothetical protein